MGGVLAAQIIPAVRLDDRGKESGLPRREAAKVQTPTLPHTGYEIWEKVFNFSGLPCLHL